MIGLDHVQYRYPNTRACALDDVSVHIEPGTCVMVTGPSGAGKTTLCLAAAGILHHEYGGRLEGTVILNGRSIGDYENLTAIAATVGISFDDPEAQLIFTTVEEEILSALEHRGLEEHEIAERLEWIMSITRLTDLRHRAPHTLSGGQKQRVVLAATLALGTDILILDEPTSELDGEGTRTIIEILRGLRLQGKTILIVEHKYSGLQNIVDTLILLEKGKITAVGHPEILMRDERVKEIVAADFTDIRRTHPPIGDRHARPIIRATDLVHRYGEIPALNGINLEIMPGESIAVVGENGSGKTTLIKHFNGLLKPTSGTVIVRDTDTANASVTELARHVGLVFQNPDHMFFRDTVRDEVAFGPQNLGIRNHDTLIDRVLSSVRLQHARDIYPRWLSRGERQRLAIACILAMQSPVIVLDEPTTGLDGRESREILEILEGLRVDGHTVIIVTHHRDMATHCCDRIITMEHGQIVSDLPAQDREKDGRNSSVCP